MSIKVLGRWSAICFLWGSASHAAVITWPNLSGAGICQGTLQDCLNEPSITAGDTVEIGANETTAPDRYTAINEQYITVSKGVTLKASRGIDAVFTRPSTVINIEIRSTAAASVVLEGLIVADGVIAIGHQVNTDGARDFTIRGLRVTNRSSSSQMINYQGSSTSTASVALNIERNQLMADRTTGTVDGITIGGVGPDARTTEINVIGNRIANFNGLSQGIRVTDPSSDQVHIEGNSVLGYGFGVALNLVINSVSLCNATVFNNVFSGQVDRFGQYNVTLVGNNLQLDFLNNTAAWNSTGVNIGKYSPTSTVVGAARNNIIAFVKGNSGFYIDPLLSATVTNSNNLVFGNPFDSFVPGPGTVTGVDPQLESPDYPKPLTGSPAINAGDNSVLSSITSLLDIQGERREFGTVDIGAYESHMGQVGTLAAAPSNIVPPNEMTLEQFRLLSSTTLLFATPHHLSPPTSDLANLLSVFYGLGGPGGGVAGWRIAHADGLTAISVGRQFSILAPLASRGAFVQASDMSNISGDRTLLDFSHLNSDPAANAFIQARNGIGPYHEHPIGLVYDAMAERWSIRNEDSVSMDTSHFFNVVVGNKPSNDINVFRINVGTAAVSEVPLFLPAFDNQPCLSPLVTKVDDPDDGVIVRNAVPFTVEYRTASGAGAPGRWFIVAEGPSSPVFPANAAFNVMVDGEQAHRCAIENLQLPIFRDGFE